MTKLHIHRRDLSESDTNAVRDLLLKAGCDDDEIDVVDTIDEPGDKSDEEIIICVLSPHVLADTELDQLLLHAIKGGRRAIGIWPKNAQATDAPTAILKYCFSVLPWNADRLRPVVGDDDFVCFESPEGQPLEMPEEERRECP